MVDHHVEQSSDINATSVVIEQVWWASFFPACGGTVSVWFGLFAFLSVADERLVEVEQINNPFDWIRSSGSNCCCMLKPQVA